MPANVILSGMGSGHLLDALDRMLNGTQPHAIGIASAFVSISGVEASISLFKNLAIKDCRLIAGTAYATTHPEALRLAQESGWTVRVGTSHRGVFHPKLIVAGRIFGAKGLIRSPSSIYIGSGNLTGGGLRINVECGLVADSALYAQQAAAAFGMLWTRGEALTEAKLRTYSALFARMNRVRSVQDIRALGMTDDSVPEVVAIDRMRGSRPPDRATVNEDFAQYVWAELRSFTGGYAFQVEFPKAAGAVLARFVRGRVSPDNKVTVRCEDGSTREMTSRYYVDNGMYRLNIPETVPNVEWARQNKEGIAVVQFVAGRRAPILLRIVAPGVEMDKIVGRSFALRTWGKTRTRLYGWC